jgi:predicted secreted Zn-dependent protease
MATFPSWAAVDANEAAWGKAMANAGAHLTAAGKLASEAIMNTELRYFSVNPRMSLVSKELAASDPFWAAKPPQ